MTGDDVRVQDEEAPPPPNLDTFEGMVVVNLAGINTHTHTHTHIPSTKILLLLNTSTHYHEFINILPEYFQAHRTSKKVDIIIRV
ncbi:hypothetical protein Pcinc_030302 [Petrolisthes cinctipes]|uniref:Uncharacterized protein n=1 Tax=Petrolisthes cinctipes TaxID=88211 RepID=A0AAE1EYE5_PETCI|nr:hypothetical protein Pcinc_030302 [Petrolisthes cinctipes]